MVANDIRLVIPVFYKSSVLLSIVALVEKSKIKYLAGKYIIQHRNFIELFSD